MTQDGPPPDEHEADKAAFLAAASAPDRRAALDRHCGTDAARRARVEALLAAHDAGSSLPTLPGTTPTPPAELPLVAGRYKLLEQIGAGGMGVVWMAEQRAPVRRLVAVKLIRAGMDSASVLARFDAERQALAMMDHPNIARVFDGGVTDAGRPYFVMELVKGLPVTDYCDARRLTVRNRLVLFADVCRAVQHAHQKGVIHRDLKPTNVLVTEHDGHPVPKVIDFGLAKALAGAAVLTDQTLHTHFGTIAGTPLYTAPEQVAINSLDVDTRADIYALGVLLYELLTGSPPLEKDRLKAAAWDEICRVIREEEAPRPSLRVSTSLTLASLAATRQTDPAKLSGLIRGDLDWIVLKTLEKDRTRRYDTATALAADVERHLNDEPVVAAPPTAGYRARKFVRKHRGPVIAVSVAAALLAGGLTATTWQWRRADHNAAIAVQNQRVADARRYEAETEAYVADLAVAVMALDNGNYADAGRRLAACPPGRRGLEWRILDQRVENRPEADFGDLETSFSPTARLVVTGPGPDGAAHLWNLAGEKVGEPFKVAALPIFSPDGQVLVAPVAGELVQLFDDLGKPVGSPMPHVAAARSVVFSPDSQLVLTAPTPDTAQWRDRLGNTVGQPVEHIWKIAGTGFPKASPAGTHLLTVIDSFRARLWTVSGEPTQQFVKFKDNYFEISKNDETFLFTSDIGFLYIESLQSDQPNRVIPAYDFQLSPDGERILAYSTTAPHASKIYDLAGNALSDSFDNYRISGEHNRDESFNFSGTLLLTQPTPSVIQIRDRDGRTVRVQMPHDTPVRSARFSPDGELILTADEANVVHLWETTGKPVGEPICNGAATWSFTTSGKYVCIGNSFYDRFGRMVCRHNINGSVIPSQSDGDSTVVNGTFSDAGTWVNGQIFRFSRLDSPVNFIDKASYPREQITLLMERTANAGSQLSTRRCRVDFRPGANDVVVIRNGAVSAVLTNDRPVAAAVVSDDGTRVVTATDRLVQFWDATSGRELAVLTATTSVRSLQITPDGTRLAIWLVDGGVEVWDSRDVSERQRERDVLFAESPAAREYVRRLSASNVSYASLLTTVMADRSLSPFGRAEAFDWATAKLRQLDWQANALLDSLVSDAFSERELRMRLASASCSTRVREAAEKRIASYTFKNDDVRRRALDILTTPGLTSDTYASAAKAMEDTYVKDPVESDDLRLLGIARYRAGRYEMAVSTLRRSADLLWSTAGQVKRDTYAALALSEVALGRMEAAQHAVDALQSETTAFADEFGPFEDEAVQCVAHATTRPGSTTTR